MARILETSYVALFRYALVWRTSMTWPLASFAIANSPVNKRRQQSRGVPRSPPVSTLAPAQRHFAFLPRSCQIGFGNRHNARSESLSFFRSLWRQLPGAYRDPCDCSYRCSQSQVVSAFEGFRLQCQHPSKLSGRTWVGLGRTRRLAANAMPLYEYSSLRKGACAKEVLASTS